MKAIWMLVVSAMIGCDQGPESARSLIARPSVDVTYERARAALRASDVPQLVWGATPFVSNSTSVAEQFQPMVDLVASRLGVPMTVRAGGSYQDIEAMLLAGDIDIAIMSPYAYVQAKAKQPGIRVFGSPVSNGTESYGAYILTREDAGIETLADLRGRPFAFVGSRSTSGWLYPASRLLDDGIDPTKDIQGTFYGSHSRVIAAISSGEVAAGATYDGALAAGRGSIDGARDLRVLARTRRIPRDAYVVRAGFPEGAIAGLAAALESVSNQRAEGRAALARLQDINGFVATDDSAYKPVREIEDVVQSLIGVGGGRLPQLNEPATEPPAGADRPGFPAARE